MATNKNISLALLIVFLLLISLGLSSYLTITNLPDTHSAIDNNRLNFGEFSRLIANDDLDSLAFLYNVVDIKERMKVFRHLKTNNKEVATFYNQHKVNYEGEFIEPIILNSGLRMLIKFANQSDNSEIVIVGRESMKNNLWWEQILQLRIGYNNNGELYFNLLNGQQEQSTKYWLFSQIHKNKPIIIEFSDSSGTVIKVTDTSGLILFNENLKENKTLGLPNGLFPGKTIRIGINLPPGGKLTIKSFYFYQFVD